MSDADHRPVDDQGGHHQGHQQGKGFPGHHIVNHHAKRRGDGGYRQGGQWDPAVVHPQQRTRGVALLSQAEQHPAVAVDAAVVDRQRGGEHHQIEGVGHNIAVNGVKDQHKGASPFHDVPPRVE